MQNKGPPPPPFSKNTRPPPPLAAKTASSSSSSSRRTQEVKKDTKTVARSRQRNNFVKQLKECINGIAPQLSDQLANDMEDEIFKISGFKQTAREYRDNGSQIKKKISDPRFRHLASKLKDTEINISNFVQQILIAKPEQVAKVKAGKGLPSFLNQPPPVLSQAKIDEKKVDNSSLTEREVLKEDGKQEQSLERNMKQDIAEVQQIVVPKTNNSKPPSRKVSKASSTNVQPESSYQSKRDEDNNNFGEFQKQQSGNSQSEIFMTTTNQSAEKIAFAQTTQQSHNHQIQDKQQHRQTHNIPLACPSLPKQSLTKRELFKAQTTIQSQSLKEEDQLNQPQTNRQKMKKAKNDLLAMISKPKIQPKNYHPSPVNQRGKIIQKQPSLTQSYIQPYNPATINKQNTDISRDNSAKKPPKRPNNRFYQKQVQNVKNLNQTIAQNPNLYSSQQLVQQQNEIKQKLILDKFETQSTVSNYNEKGSTSFNKIRPFSAQQFIESHKKKQRSSVSSPKNSQQDPNENVNQKQNNYMMSSSIIGPSQTPSRHGPASITTYNQSLCNLQQAYDTRKKQLQETKKLLTKSQLELKAERNKGQLLNQQNQKLQNQVHKLQKKKKVSRKDQRNRGYVDGNDQISSQNTSSDEQKSSNLVKQQQVEMQKMRKQLSIQSKELSNLRSSVQGKNKVIEQMNKSNQEMNSRFKAYKEQMNSNLQKLTTNMQKKNQKSQQLQQQQQSSAEKLRAQANAYQIQIRRLKQQCNKLKQQNQTLKRSQRPQNYDSPQNYSLRSNNSNSQLLNIRQESDQAPISTTTSVPQNNPSRNSSSLSELHPSILASTTPANNYLTRNYNSDQANVSINQQEHTTEYMSDSNIIYQSGSGFQQYQPMIVPPSSSGSADHRAPNYPTIINQDTGEYHLVSVTDAIGGGAGAADSVQDSQYQHQSESGGAGDFFGQRTTFTHLYSHQQQENVDSYHGQYPQGENIQNSSTERSSQRPQATTGNQ